MFEKFIIVSYLFWWSVPLILEKSILVPKLYLFIYFSFLFRWEERGESSNSGVERKGCRWQWFWPLKWLIFYVKWFHIMRGVQIRCFLGSVYNNILELGKSFGFRLILGFEVVFCVLKVMNWFNMVPIVLSRCFEENMGWKWVFKRKKQEPCFSGNHSAQNLRGSRWHIVYFFQNKLGWTTH